MNSAFGLFNRSSLAIAGLVERLDLIEVSSDIRSHIARAYMDLVTLISSIAIRYHKAAQSMMAPGNEIGLLLNSHRQNDFADVS